MVMDVKGKIKDNIKARIDIAFFVIIKLWSSFMLGHGSQIPKPVSP
jgi:hypothetical protein